MTRKKIVIKGALRLYILFPLILIPVMVILTAVLFPINIKAGIVALCFTIAITAFAIVVYVLNRPKVVASLVRFAVGYNKMQRRLSKELMMPYAVLDVDGRIVWLNDAFAELTGEEKAKGHHVFQLFDGIDAGVLPSVEEDTSIHIIHEERNYIAVFRRINAANSADDIFWTYEENGGESSHGDLISMYLIDETEVVNAQKELNDQKLIVALIYIDNYEEALASVDEVRRSLLIALIDRKIQKSMQQFDAIVKKLEKDKYICLFPNKYLNQLRQNRFPVLDEVRSVNIGNELPVTISMGISAESGSYDKAYERARAAIDLALGRGGDQVVLREGENNIYYGGKSMSVEKNTRVKARVKAHALRELIEGKDEIFVMGHSIGDVDSFGSAVGVYRIAKSLNTKAHIVLNEITTSMRPVVNRFLNNAEYEEDLLLNSEEAKEKITKDALLIIVDVNRTSYTECPELVDIVESCVIIDHHRLTGEIPANAVLSYIEPYASSACEMVAEILQYSGDEVKLKMVEADTMYAGMMVDTNNFLSKTGVRTFEAAAFLKRNGADVTRIRKMFRTDLNEYQIKASVISKAEVYNGCFAFGRIETEISGSVESPTVLAAQTANELMEIANIKAAFVLSYYNNKIYVSARSIDEYNVQVLTEKFGGGGHMSAAGCQFTDATMDEVEAKIKAALDEKEGEI